MLKRDQLNFSSTISYKFKIFSDAYIIIWLYINGKNKELYEDICINNREYMYIENNV